MKEMTSEHQIRVTVWGENVQSFLTGIKFVPADALKLFNEGTLRFSELMQILFAENWRHDSQRLRFQNQNEEIFYRPVAE